MLYGLVAQEEKEATAAPAYVAKAVHFAGAIQSNGPTWLNLAAISAGTDNGLFALSMWAKGWDLSANVNGLIFITDPAGAYAPEFQLGGSRRVLWNSYSGGSQYLNAEYTGVSGSGWHHILASYDTNQSVGNKIAAFYIDDVQKSGSAYYADAGAGFISAINGKRFVFGDDGAGASGIDCDFADVWIAPNIGLHSGTAIPDATRRLFIGPDLKPVDPAGWPAAAIKLTGDSTTFATNLGTGGSFTVQGTLTDASTHP